MFNISFSNKTQLKIKNIFFILLDRTRFRFNAFLALHRTGPAGAVEHAPLFIKENPWTVEHAPLFMSFPAEEAANCCFLQSCGHATINRRSH